MKQTLSSPRTFCHGEQRRTAFHPFQAPLGRRWEWMRLFLSSCCIFSRLVSWFSCSTTTATATVTAMMAAAWYVIG